MVATYSQSAAHADRRSIVCVCVCVSSRFIILGLPVFVDAAGAVCSSSSDGNARE